jgi:hypothetical protein
MFSFCTDKIRITSFHKEVLPLSRTAINVVYIAFLVIMTLLLPALLLMGTGGSLEGMIAAILSFAVMASYVIYTLLLGARNS